MIIRIKVHFPQFPEVDFRICPSVMTNMELKKRQSVFSEEVGC